MWLDSTESVKLTTWRRQNSTATHLNCNISKLILLSYLPGCWTQTFSVATVWRWIQHCCCSLLSLPNTHFNRSNQPKHSTSPCMFSREVLKHNSLPTNEMWVLTHPKLFRCVPSCRAELILRMMQRRPLTIYVQHEHDDDWQCCIQLSQWHAHNLAALTQRNLLQSINVVWACFLDPVVPSLYAFSNGNGWQG